MSKLRQVYDRVDEKIRELSRTKYAVLIGFTAGFSALITSAAFGEPDTVFSTTLGLTMTVIYYISNPNQN